MTDGNGAKDLLSGHRKKLLNYLKCSYAQERIDTRHGFMSEMTLFPHHASQKLSVVVVLFDNPHSPHAADYPMRVVLPYRDRDLYAEAIAAKKRVRLIGHHVLCAPDSPIAVKQAETTAFVCDAFLATVIDQKAAQLWGTQQKLIRRVDMLQQQWAAMTNRNVIDACNAKSTVSE